MNFLSRFFLPLTFLLAVLVPEARAEDEQATKSIPMDQLGVEAQKQYSGDGISIKPTEHGARLRSTFQKLEGEATSEGLWLSSMSETAGGRERFRVLATAVGRCTTTPQSLRTRGMVTTTAETATLMRPGLLEEYRVSMDGVRQDFVVVQRPEGTGALRVTLEVAGAQVSAADYGVMLTLPRSGREVGYSRLHVTDANGRELSARLEVISQDRISVCVEDDAATYPVRIDPTFSDADWVSMNPNAFGTNGVIYAMAADGSGNLYVGGNFTIAGRAAASNIAKWDGAMWSPVGTGMNGGVSTLKISGSDLYAGGGFSTAGGITVNYVAKWNGSAWSALGAGMNNWVQTLTVDGGTLYAGGGFTTAGGVPASRVACWDGNAWAALGTGVNDAVLAVAAMDGDLYAGGVFTMAGDVEANCIARWNGSTWSVVGEGVAFPLAGTVPSVNVLVANGTTLYVGGNFFETLNEDGEEIGSRGVATWDGRAWSALGSGIDLQVVALAVSGPNVYAGGARTSLSGPSSVIYKWDGNSWSSLGSGLAGGLPAGGVNSSYAPAVFALELSGTDLYAGGSFGSIGGGGGALAWAGAKWDGNAWSPLHREIDKDISVLKVSGSYLYAGGAFTTAGGVVVNGVGRWNGGTWEALGTGVNGRVMALLVNGNDVYAGGDFTMAGGVVVNGIARWDGCHWNALGQGVGGVASPYVDALAMIGTNLYAGGSFLTAGGTYVSYIARWDGVAWSALGTGTNRRVSALAVMGGDLYAGGYFGYVDNVVVSSVAKWNGVVWSALGAGYPNVVNVLAVSGGRLYVGGNSGVSFWDGNSWFGLPPAIEGVNALTVSGTNLYVGGYYSYSSETVHCLAKWDGNAWSAFGSDITFSNPLPVIKALAVDADNHLFLGGAYFTTVGNGIRSPYLAQANLPAPAPDIAVTQAAALTDGSGGVDFGPVVAGGGSAALTFTLSNPGDAELSGLSVNLDGANSGDFAVSTLARSSFIPGESLTFTVTYAPGATVGSSAALHIVSNVSGSKSSFDIALSGMGVTANQGWQQQYFGVITGAGNAAPGADPNHNGIPNLLEYALGGKPVGAATGPSVLPRATVNATGNCLQINFKRYLERNDITLTVQAADNLAGPWTDLAQSVNGSAFSVITPGISISEEAGGNPRGVSISDLYLTTDTAHPRRFMRLKVSQ